MTFIEILEEMKSGKFVYRVAWNGEQVIWLKPKFVIDEKMCHDKMLKQLCNNSPNGTVVGEPSFSVFKSDSISGSFMLSAIDVLSDDWMVSEVAE